MSKILITGGTGLLGKTISEILLKNDHNVVWLSREPGDYKDITKFKWDLSKNYIDEKAFEGVESIIHLAGAPIADKRWTNSYKKEIIDSRVKSSNLLFNYISKNNYPIKNFIGGSAMGYYGSGISEKIFTEENAAGSDFLAESCILWEKSYEPFIQKGIRTVIIRTGVVLSKHEGAYAKMAPPFKLGFGAAVASGKQYFPWIHVNDIANIFIYALQNQNTQGIYNGVSSEFINNKDFSRQLATSFNKPFFMPNVPGFLLKIVMGEASIMLTGGLKISNEKIKKTGFKFEFETAKEALQSLV
jgi:uncharacterized protein (TIGR01777 family)